MTRAVTRVPARFLKKYKIVKICEAVTNVKSQDPKKIKGVIIHPGKTQSINRGV